MTDIAMDDKNEAALTIQFRKQLPFGTTWSYERTTYLHIRQSRSVLWHGTLEKPNRWVFHGECNSVPIVDEHMVKNLNLQRMRHCLRKYVPFIHHCIHRYDFMDCDVLRVLFSYLLLVY
jgi:hypothetical protein